MEQSFEAREESRNTEDEMKEFEAGNLDIVSINDSLQVTVADDPNPSNYYSRVQNIEGGKLFIAWPTQRGIRLPARIEQKLNFTFLRDGIPFMFSGVVDEKDGGSLPQITIIPVAPIVKTQRRQNFRLKCLMPVEITWTEYSSGPNKGKEKIQKITTSTYDLSAGGIGIRYSKAIPEGTLAEIKLKLPDDDPVIKIPCRIAYTERLPENPSMSHTGVQFLEISEREKARIVRYLYHLQIQGLKL